MTSEKLSPVNIIKFQKNLLKERNWQVIIVALYFVLYYLGSSATAVFFIKNENGSDMIYSLRECSNIIFGVYLTAAPLVGMAVFSALLGYMYLYNRQKVDFYEAQCIKRGFRWWNIYFNGILIVVIPYVLSAFIGYAFMSLIGYTDMKVFSAMCISIARSILLYLSVYSVAVLSAMLCGNLLIALMGSIVLLSLASNLKLVFTGLSSLLYVTYSSATPHYNGLLSDFSLSPVENFLVNNTVSNLSNVFITIVITLISYLTFRIRRNEMAGATIAYKKARVIIKIVLAATWSINVTWFYLLTIENRRSFPTLIFITAVIIVNSMLISVILEAILSLNIRTCLKNFSHSFAVIAITLIIFFGMYTDITGYDRFIPAPPSVESYALLRGGYFNYFDETGAILSSETYKNQNMKITDKDSMDELAKIATANTLSLKKSGDLINGYEVTVIYRLRNGKSIPRRLIIPYDVDSSLMDRIISSDEYKDGFFPSRADENFLNNYRSRQAISYSFLDKKLSLNKDVSSKYQELKKAYEEDLKNYSYSEEKNATPLGLVTLEGHRKKGDSLDDYFGDSNSELEFPVYDNYSNTINFLKNNDLWIEGSIDPSDIEMVKVSKYDHYDNENIFGKYISETDYDYDSEEYEDYEEYEDIETDVNTREYTDPEDIAEVCSNIYSNNNYIFWRSPIEGNTQYDVYLYYKNEAAHKFTDYPDSYSNYVNCHFKCGKLPSFIKDDFLK